MTAPLDAIIRQGLSPYVFAGPPSPVRVRLDANESPWPLPAAVTTALAEHLATVALHRYPDPTARELKAALGAYASVDPGRIVLGNGSDELIALICTAFGVPRAGHDVARIAFAAPSFVMYALASRAQGLQPVEIPLDADFQLSPAALDHALATQRPNVVFLARPNNPTGTLWHAPPILGAIAAHSDTLFVVDEAYHEYAGSTLVDAVAGADNLLILRTLSKIGLASLRLGYAIATPKVAAVLEAVRAPYNVGGLAQAAATFILTQHAELLRTHVASVVAERTRLAARLAALPGVTAFPSSANLILVRVGTPADGVSVQRALAERGVMTRGFGAQGPLAGCLRITVGTPAESDALLEAWPG